MSQEVHDIKLVLEGENGRYSHPATIAFVDDRIEFLKSPFKLKDEIKAMAGAKWHGFEKEPRKIWSIKDCPRNRFQLGYLMDQDVYAWFDRELIEHEYPEDFYKHQCLLVNLGLTYHFQIWAAEPGTGKTRAAIELMKKSGVAKWYWVGPKPTLPAIRREFNKWGMDPSVNIEMLTYEGLVRVADEGVSDADLPQGIIFDESQRLKNALSQRSRAAQYMADRIRETYKEDGFVILMSGTPSPKTPVNWWSQAEIAYPGFLKEGSPQSLEERLAIMAPRQVEGQVFKQRVAWRDREDICGICGESLEEGNHFEALDYESYDGLWEHTHAYSKCKNEVAYLGERLKGLATVVFKKDCLDLPDKFYRRIECKPTASMLRVAQAIANSSPNAITAMTLLRELSDGFQYRDEADGKTRCTHCQKGKIDEWFDPENEHRTFRAVDMLDADLVARLEKRQVDCPNCEGKAQVTKYVRTAKQVPCPKDEALIDLLDECDDQGRILIFAGFTGSVDRVVELCLGQKWNVVRLDGRGYHVITPDGEVEIDPLDYWADLEGNERVAFVAHPESGGLGLTLTEASMAVFYSNSFKPDFRIQAEDRIHRPGADHNRGVTIVDLVHLPSDERVIEIIKENRRLELLTMGEALGEAFAQNKAAA